MVGRGLPILFARAGNAERNRLQHLGPTSAQVWHQDRAVVLSELAFKTKMFLKTVAYEILPVPIAAPLCAIFDGYTNARNRFDLFRGNVAFTFLVLVTDAALLTWTSVGVFCFYHEELPAVALYELVGYLLLPMVGRALTVGAKYALYSDLLLSGDQAQSLKCKEYLESGQQGKNQMTSYVADLDRKQKENLVRFVYSSCLYADTDLSCASLRWQIEPAHPAAARECDEHPEEHGSMHLRRRIRVASRSAHLGDFSEQKATLQGAWRAVGRILRGQADAASVLEVVGSGGGAEHGSSERAIEESSVPAARQHAVAVSDEMVFAEGWHGSEPRPASARESGEEAGGGREEAGGGREGAGGGREGAGGGREQHHLVDGAAGLVGTLLREERGALRRRLGEGELPCSLVALHIVLHASCSASLRRNSGALLFLLCAVMRFVLPFVPVLVRALDAEEASKPFGSTSAEQIYYGLQILPNSAWALTLLWYACAPCAWYYRQLRMAQRMLDLIAAPRGVAVAWKTARPGHSKTGAEEGGEDADGEVGEVVLPRLDLTDPHNVEGWAMLRRVVYGRNFAPTVELKFQVYGTITFLVFLASSATNSIAHFYTHPSSSAPASAEPSSSSVQDFDFVFTSIFRLVVLSIPLFAQVLLAFRVNEFSKLFTRALTAQALSCSAEAAALSLHPTDDSARQAEQLSHASALLSATKDEIESEMEAAPMRVLFATASPAVVSILVSAIFMVLAIQVNGVRWMM